MNKNKKKTHFKKKKTHFKKKLVLKKKCQFWAVWLSLASKCQKKRMYALSARSGLADKCPPPQDNNIWKQLIASRQGYIYLAKILAWIHGLLMKNGNVSHTGPNNLSPYQKGLRAIFAKERSKSYQTIQNRRGTPSFPIEEVNNILFLCGRKMTEDTTSDQPSIHKQDAHYLLEDA